MRSVILFPILIIQSVLAICLRLVPHFTGKRLSLEKRWPLLENEQFHYLFHVSSEGELEQVLPIIDKLISKGVGDIGLTFTSPSLERRLKNLSSVYSRRDLVVFALPIANLFGFINFIKLRPSKFFMVRYDFFPQLLWIASSSGVTSYLMSFTLKNKRLEKLSVFTYYKFILNCFKHIFPADEKSLLRTREFFNNLKTECHNPTELRINQILDRWETSDQTFTNRKLDSFVDFWKKVECSNRWVLGSCWLSDLTIFEDSQHLDSWIKEGAKFYIAPHKLSGIDAENIILFFQKLASHKGIKCLVLDQKVDGVVNYDDYTLFISLVPGVLCEMYKFGGNIYVGGGFERSIHSVLEPFFSQSLIAVGPKIHRSTEYDFIDSLDKDSVRVIKSIDEFYGRNLPTQDRIKLGIEFKLKNNELIDQFSR